MKVIEFNNKPSNSTIKEHLEELIKAFEKQGVADDECICITLLAERPTEPALMSCSNWTVVDSATVGAWDMAKDTIKQMVSYVYEDDEDD